MRLNEFTIKAKDAVSLSKDGYRQLNPDGSDATNEQVVFRQMKMASEFLKVGLRHLQQVLEMLDFEEEDHAPDLQPPTQKSKASQLTL